MKKKVFKALSIAVVLTLCVAVLVACYADNKYFTTVSSFEFWDNEGSEAIAQPQIYNVVKDHMTSALPEGKTAKKVAFIGYDGCRADALVNVLQSGIKDKNGYDIYSGANSESVGSAIVSVKNMSEQAGVYIAHAGGYKGQANEQHPSTAPGWASLLTGMWGIDNGITDNGMPLNIAKAKTFLLDYAENGIGINGGAAIKYSSAFVASWGPHFTENYTPEIDYLNQKNAAGAGIDMLYQRVANDLELHEYLKACASVGGGSANITQYKENEEGDIVADGQKVIDVAERDIIFGIYELTDHNGHDKKFGNDNPGYVKGFRDEDAMAFELIQTILNRSTYDSEDWLFVITTDHGGIESWHGGQTLEERTTWVVSSKGVDSKYFSKNYNGYVIK